MKTFTAAEALAWMSDRLDRREPFCHLRFNDGEMVMMLKKYPDMHVLGDCVYPHACGEELKIVLDLTGRRGVDEGGPDYLFGSSLVDAPDALAEQFAGFLNEVKADRFPWTVGQPLIDCLTVGDTVRLLEQLRGRQVVLVGNAAIADARHCLGAALVEIPPPKDGWPVKPWLRGLFHRLATPGTVFVWCCGGYLKPTAWALSVACPGTTHIDAGHLFDGLSGERTRGWMMYERPPWAYYRDTFLPWVKSFIP